MKNIKIFTAVLLLVTAFTFQGCKLGRFVYYNFADINDHKIFPSNAIKTDSVHFVFPVAQSPKAPKTITIGGDKQVVFDKFLEKYSTVAFLIIHNDSIQYENYFDGYKQESIVPSFSVAKSITSILIGCAIEDGYIKSVDDPVSNYLPEMKKGFEKVTIKHLLQMTSGVRFNENYINPFGPTASFYYGRNLHKEVKKLKVSQAAGLEFDYASGNTQVLGNVLEKALKDKTISQYLQEKIWLPLGMEYDASWSLDRKKNGIEKTFCCVNARARDYAKIGRLYLNKGNWEGKQVINKEWVMVSTKVDTTQGSAWYYQYCWWLPTTNGDFMAHGILGQYIYVNPAKNLIMVRLGRKEDNVDWDTVFISLAKNFN